LLGSFEFTQNGRPLDGGNGFKAQKLLKLLLASAQRPVPRDVLIEHLWPDVSPAAGRRNVHQAVHALRKTLRERDPGGTHVVLDHESYRLDPGADLWCDVTEYESCVRRARELEAAGDFCGSIDAYGVADRLYRGDYLEDSPFEEWTIAERERLRMVQADVTHHLGERLLAADRVDEAIAVSQRALARDPADESAHQRVMRCHLARGQRTQALQQFDQCAELLQRKYGLAPTAETLALRRMACES
jgi:DNA-binding SARP family transcriptional activator